MNARAPVGGRVIAQVPGRAFSFDIDSGRIEAFKWFALVAMLTAHVAQYVFNVTAGWPIEVGRLAFPLFAVGFAIPLALDPRERGYKLALVLAPFAVAAQILVQPMRDISALNILFLYLACGAWFAAEDEAPARFITIRVCCLVVAFLSEFSLPGFFFVICLVRFFQTEDDNWGWGVVVWYLAVCAFEHSFYGCLALPVVIFIDAYSLRVPRIGRIFPWIYVLQFAAYGLARGL